jgi:hypothetical protein
MKVPTFSGLTAAALITISLVPRVAGSEAIAASEAVTVLGMTLGEPFTVPECKTPDDSNKPIFSSWHETCWTLTVSRRLMAFMERQKPGSSQIFMSPKVIWYKGDPIIGASIDAHVEDGILEALTFQNEGIKDQENVMAKLIEKFGKPSMFIKAPMQNRFGANFLVYRAEWKRHDVHVRYDADCSKGDLDCGWVVIETASFYAKGVKAREEYNREHPSKL